MWEAAKDYIDRVSKELGEQSSIQIGHRNEPGT
jgi:hypothetical protein